MSALHNLTLRTATAVGRLAELQRRADAATENRSTIARSALAELSTALEELQVANEALQTQVDEMTASRMSAENAFSTMAEFVEALPIAAVWTDHAGVIENANEAASQLLNVGKPHLVGKPLLLFTTDRAALFGALQCLSEANRVASVDFDITVRPRERRSRKMTMSGRRLQHDPRCVWFFHGGQLTRDHEIPPLSLVGEK